MVVVGGRERREEVRALGWGEHGEHRGAEDGFNVVDRVKGECMSVGGLTRARFVRALCKVGSCECKNFGHCLVVISARTEVRFSVPSSFEGHPAKHE